MVKALKFKEPLKKHCSFGVGGPADYYCEAKNIKELTDLIKFSKKARIPYLIIGAGTNILFDDKGFRGIVIKMNLKNIKIQNSKIIADAGASISALIQESLKNNLQGLEKWAGLPGTVGGAVAGNAGCNGLEIKDILVKAKLLNPLTGKIKEVNNKYFKFKYRESILKKSGEILISAAFELKKAKSIENFKKILKEILSSRLKKQPFGPSAGSFFKNPSAQKPAGFLIEKAGLKGKKIGNAQISEKHANFIINLGNASSKDILSLARLIQKTVKKAFKITLKPEVQILNEHGKIKL